MDNQRDSIQPSLPKKAKKKRIVKLLSIGLLIFVLVAGVGWWYYSSTKNQREADESSGEPLTRIDNRTQAEKDADSLLSSTRGEEGGEKYIEVNQELVRRLDAATSQEDKEAYLLALIDLHYNSAQYDTALERALQLEELDESALAAGWIATVYMAMARFDEAAQYYQTAADRSEKTDDPTQASPYNNYLNKKREAEKRQS